MRVTTDGGRFWRSSRPGVTNAQFSNPFVMDPTDDDHLMTDLDDDRGFDRDPVLPATGGGLALVGLLSMALGALVVVLPGRRRGRH